MFQLAISTRHGNDTRKMNIALKILDARTHLKGIVNEIKISINCS